MNAAEAPEYETLEERVWSVLVVEDDPDVADLHRRLVDATPGFSTVRVVPNGRRALEAMRQCPVDVAIVDLTMPGGDGMTLIRMLRQESFDVDVIVVTASRDSRTVREAMRLGVLDYLVKPFAPERLHRSLEAFGRRARALCRPQLAQADLDLVQANGAAIRRLPKGLKPSTLDAVTTALRASPGGLSADELAHAIGASRVTARRYLEYLDVVGIACMQREYCGSGRPRHRYCWREPVVPH